MNRREFLQMRAGADCGSLELSCEGLYMRYLDSQLNGTSAQLFECLDGQLRGVREVRLRDSAWLVREDLKQRLEPLLATFRARGGRVAFE